MPTSRPPAAWSVRRSRSKRTRLASRTLRSRCSGRARRRWRPTAPPSSCALAYTAAPWSAASWAATCFDTSSVPPVISVSLHLLHGPVFSFPRGLEIAHQSYLYICVFLKPLGAFSLAALAALCYSRASLVFYGGGEAAGPPFPLFSP